MKGNKDKLDKLIGEMSHFDPDNMQMGAKAVTQLVLSGQLALDQDQKAANTIRQAFMKQMQSQNYNVHAHAIKCVAQLAPKLPGNQVEAIFERILEIIGNLNLDEKKRQRYGVCAATVIHQAAEEYGEKLSNLFVRAIIKLLEIKDKKTDVQVILINIITEFIKKWPLVSANPPFKMTYDRKSLVIYLLKNVQYKSKTDIIKKSQNCLGKVTLIVDKEVLDVLLNNAQYGLLPYIQKNKVLNKPDHLKHLRNGLFCLSQVLKTHRVQLKYWIKPICKQLIDIINRYKCEKQIDNIEAVCDILEASLTSLSYCLKSYARELQEVLKHPNNEFQQFVEELINFNVEGMMSYAAEPMEVQGEYGQNQDYYHYQAENDQKCWKVRRAIIHYISFLAKRDHQFLNNFGNGQLVQTLGLKLIEQNSMVSEMAFFTFNQLIKLISVDRTNIQYQQEDSLDGPALQRIKSSANTLAQRIIDQITNRIKIIFNNSKFNDQLKIQASKILLKIIELFYDKVIQNQTFFLLLLRSVLQELRKTTIVENKNNLLLCLKELVSANTSYANYAGVFAVFMQTAGKAANVKIQNTAIVGIKKLVQTFPREFAGTAEHYGRVLNFLKVKVWQHDADKTVKINIFKCLAAVFQNCTLREVDVVDFLRALSNKLKVEIQKTYIVDTVVSLRRGNEGNSEEKVKLIQIIVRQLTQHLGSHNYQLNVKSIEAINQLLLILSSKYNPNMIEQILQRSKILLNEGKIPSFFRPIMQDNPKWLKPYTELIIKSAQIQYIEKLLLAGIVDGNVCVKILRGCDKMERGRRISVILSKIKVEEGELRQGADQTQWGRICIGTLGYIGNSNTFAFLMSKIPSFKTQQTKHELASAIGNIISRNQSTMLPIIIQHADNNEDDYVYINIIKETLKFSEGSFAMLKQLTQWLLGKCQNKFKMQSSYSIISECLGKIALSSEQNARIIISNSASTIQNRRLVVGNSLRFCLQNRPCMDIEFVSDYIHHTMKMMSDQSVKVRQGATKSLNSIGVKYIKNIKKYQDSTFWKGVLQNCKIHDHLIRIIDYGISKQRIDDGKNLRLQSFTLLQILIKKVTLDEALAEELMSVCLHRFVEETVNDIVLKRLGVLRTLCALDFSPFIRLQELFVRQVGVKDGLLKRYEKKGFADQRTAVYLKGVLREIVQINCLSQQQNFNIVGTLIAELKLNATLCAIFDGFEKIVK